MGDNFRAKFLALIYNFTCATIKLPWQPSACQCYKDGGKVLNCYV